MIRVENLSKNESESANSRRDFLKSMLSAGALVLGVSVIPEQLFAAAGSSAAGDPFPPSDKAPLQPSVYLAIGTDGTAYVVAHRSEMGNGVRTSLPRIVAEELDADWARVKVVQAIGSEKYGDQDTDGSHSVVSFFVPLREAGATARLMLVRAAAQQWGVPATECSTELHHVTHKASGKMAGYGDLATAASKLDVPKKEELKLKPRSEWRYIGKPAPNYDLKDLCTGKATYGQDTHMPGMLYASIAHPPVLGSTVKSVDDSAALTVSGVKQTATIDTFKPPVLFQALGGVAVLADNTWAAMQGRKKLKAAPAETPQAPEQPATDTAQLQSAIKEAKDKVLGLAQDVDIAQRKFSLDSDMYYGKTDYKEDKAGKAALDSETAAINDKKQQLAEARAILASLQGKLGPSKDQKQPPSGAKQN